MSQGWRKAAPPILGGEEGAVLIWSEGSITLHRKIRTTPSSPPCFSQRGAALLLALYSKPRTIFIVQFFLKSHRKSGKRFIDRTFRGKIAFHQIKIIDYESMRFAAYGFRFFKWWAFVSS